MARQNNRALWAEKISDLQQRPPTLASKKAKSGATAKSGASILLANEAAATKSGASILLANGAAATSEAAEARFGARRAYEGCVLGIDPSLRGTGLAVVEFSAQGDGAPALCASRTLHLGRELSMPQCLGEIYKAVADYIEDWPIRHVVLEQTIYVQNFQTAQILGSARGAAIAAASVLGKTVFEYPPLRVKQAVAGFGRASKPQIAGMIHRLLALPESLPFDESDAAAVALCHAYTWRA